MHAFKNFLSVRTVCHCLQKILATKSSALAASSVLCWQECADFFPIGLGKNLFKLCAGADTSLDQIAHLCLRRSALKNTNWTVPGFRSSSLPLTSTSPSMPSSHASRVMRRAAGGSGGPRTLLFPHLPWRKNGHEHLDQCDAVADQDECLARHQRPDRHGVEGQRGHLRLPCSGVQRRFP